MRKTTWSLEQIRTYANDLVPSKRGKIEDLINSIARNDSIFRYHMFKARDALKEVANQEDPLGIDNFKLLLGDSCNSKELQDALVVSEANLIGCAYTGRNMVDVFSQLVNQILLCGKIPEDKCDLYWLLNALPEGNFRAKVETLKASHWFSYLHAFINTIKHRQLVNHQASMSFECEKFGIKVGAFQYRGITYPAYWGSEVLEGLVGVKNTIIELGIALNHEIYTTGSSGETLEV